MHETIVLSKVNITIGSSVYIESDEQHLIFCSLIYDN